MTDTNFRLSYTARDFEKITEELQDFILQTRPVLWSDFYDSNLGQALLQFVALVGDMLSYGQDATATTVFLSTMRRYESAVRFARDIGYPIRTAASAEAEVNASTLPAALTANGGTIAAGARITGLNGLYYELLDDVAIAIGDTEVDMSLFEGSSHTDTYNTVDEAWHEVKSTAAVVASNPLQDTSFGSWRVFVGSTANPANEWTEVDWVFEEESATQTYETLFDGDGYLTVRFGDGVTGKIPDDTITLIYRTTNGQSGNAPIGSVRGQIQASITGGLGTASLTFENTTEAASGGDDRETLSELKTNVPAYIRSVDKFLTLNDYNTGLARIPGVALGVADRSLSSYEANVVIVRAWSYENVTFTSEDTGAGVETEADYVRYLQMPTQLENEVAEYLRTRTLLTVQNSIEDAHVGNIDLYFSDIKYDRRYTAESVRTAVTEALVAVFENGDGYIVRLSDIYEALENVPSVQHFYIDRLVFEGYKSPHATGSVTFVSAANPVQGDYITIDDGATVGVFEFVNAYGNSAQANALEVLISANAAETLRNFVAVVNVNLVIDAQENEDAPVTDPEMLLEHTLSGSKCNVPITLNAATPANYTIVGMVNGADSPVLTIEDYRRIQAPFTDRWPAADPDDWGDLRRADWAALSTYGLGAQVQPTIPNGRRYTATAGGLSAAIEPVWGTAPHVGDTIVDGTVTWTCAEEKLYADHTLVAPNIATGFYYLRVADGLAGLSEPTWPTTLGGTVADDGSHPWGALSAYILEDLVQPTTPNGYRYQCTQAGTTAAGEPTWPTTIGDTVTDGTVIWRCEALATWQCVPLSGYYPGAPYADTGEWADAGQKPYAPLQDIDASLSENLVYYDGSYLYNGEILYNSGEGEGLEVQALNLRRVVFGLISV